MPMALQRRPLTSMRCLVGILSISTAAFVNTARLAVSFRTGFQTDVFGIEGDGPIFQDIAWDTHVANRFRFLKCGVRIPQIQELLEVPDMFADIDYLEVGIAFNLFLYILAVRASMHYVHLDHKAISCNRLW